MKIRLFLILAFIQTLISSQSSYAHEPGDNKVVFLRPKVYLSNDYDGALISTAFHSDPLPMNGGVPTSVGTPRFTYFLNIGVNLNYDISRSVGIFTGVGIKNIGFIEKTAPLDSTIKRRVYAVGLPVGIKIGALRKKMYGFLGGGIDIPVLYKEKGFVKRSKKDKFHEWFSERTASYMPYAFAGVCMKPGIYLKVQLYPGNFMNPEYSETITSGGVVTVAKPYARYDIAVLMFSIGMDIRYGNRMKIKHKEHHKNMM